MAPRQIKSNVFFLIYLLETYNCDLPTLSRPRPFPLLGVERKKKVQEKGLFAPIPKRRKNVLVTRLRDLSTCVSYKTGGDVPGVYSNVMSQIRGQQDAPFYIIC